MGLLPAQLAELTPFVFFEYKVKGFNELKREEEAIFRRLAYFTIAPHAKEGFDITKQWKIEGDDAAKSNSALTTSQAQRMVDNLVKNKAKLKENG